MLAQFKRSNTSSVDEDPQVKRTFACVLPAKRQSLDSGPADLPSESVFKLPFPITPYSL